MYNPKPKQDKNYKFPCQCIWLMLNGSWPLPRKSKNKSLRNYIFHIFYNIWGWYVICCVGITICFQSAFLFNNFGNIILTTESCCSTLMGIMNFVRLLHFRLNQNQFRKTIFQFSQEIWITKESHPQHKKECIKKMYIFGIMTLLLSCLISMYCIVPLVELFFLEKGNNIEKPFPYKMLFPFDAHHGFSYMFTYMFTSYAGICVVTTLFAEDSIFGFFLTYTCGQFSILHERIDTLLFETFQHSYGIADKAHLQQLFTRRLNEIAKKHIKLIEFVKALEQFFSPILLINFGISALLICMVGFQLVTSKGMFIGDYIKFFIYILSSLSQLFLLCLTGDTLIQKSAATAEHLYFCYWEGCNIKLTEKGNKQDSLRPNSAFLMNLRFMIMVSQSPLKITAYKFSTISLQSFKTILSTSMSYFTLLQTMYDKQ